MEIRKFKRAYPEVSHFLNSELALIFKLFQLGERTQQKKANQLIFLFTGDLLNFVALLFSSAIAEGSLSLFRDLNFLEVMFVSPIASGFSAMGIILVLQLWSYLLPSEEYE